MARQDSDNSTHFGYQTVDADDKAHLVRDVFDSVASRYDIMNDLMSAGLHRLWKRYTVDQAAVRPGDVVLDLAGGTGDLALAFVDAGVAGNVSIAQVDAQALPFESGTFDCVTMAFGLRNVTDKEAALRSIYGTLKPGGKAMILEFSEPNRVIKPAYDLYSFKVLPALGSLIAKDSDSYQYLAESIRMHPDQETLKSMM